MELVVVPTGPTIRDRAPLVIDLADVLHSACAIYRQVAREWPGEPNVRVTALAVLTTITLAHGCRDFSARHPATARWPALPWAVVFGTEGPGAVPLLRVLKATLRALEDRWPDDPSSLPDYDAFAREAILATLRQVLPSLPGTAG